MTSRMLGGLLAAAMLATALQALPSQSVSAASGPRLTAPRAPAIPDHAFAVTLWLPDGAAAVEGRIAFRNGAAEVIGVAPTGAGRSFSPVETASGAAFGAYGIGTEDGARALDIVVNPLLPGNLQLRVAIDSVVDGAGSRIDAPVNQLVVSVPVVGDGTVHAAPGLSERSAPQRNARAVRELQRDGRFDGADLAEAQDSWLQTHELSRESGPACQAGITADANDDGCLDIADVQATLAAQGSTTTAVDPAPAGVAEEEFIVDSTADTADDDPGDGECADSMGRCTLRAAINESNWLPSSDQISFNLPGTAPVRIQLDNPLPSIHDDAAGTIIDGFTQPGSSANTSTTSSNAVPGVELRGNGFAERERAFYVTSAGNTIRGFAIQNFYNGVFLDGPDAHGNRIVGNWIGFAADGTNANGQRFNVAINNGAHDNVVGGPDPADRNVSGNAFHGVELFGSGVTGNVIQNNLFCMRPNGTATAPCSVGIDHNFGPQDGLIGGSNPNERNVFGPTTQQAIELSHGWDPDVGAGNGGTPEWQVNGHSIIGNWIGFRGDGSYSAAFRSATNVPSSDNGQAVNIYDGSNGNLVEANYIASNYDGITFSSGNAEGNTARANIIGESPLGQDAPMARWGIKVRQATKLHVLEANVIRNAQLGGIGLVDDNVFQIRITRNVVTATDGPAIDLRGVAGPDPNDAGDADQGANTLLNTPVITSATTALVSGTGLAGAKVEVFRANRPAGEHGLPNLYLGQTTVAGNGSWSLAVSMNVGQRVTALQIRNDRDTSELSANREVTIHSGVFAADAFNRTVSGGWGTADVGGDWSVPNNGSDFAVNGSAGTMRMGRAGKLRTMALADVSVRDVDVRFSVSGSAIAQSSSFVAWTEVRREDNTTYYRTKLRVGGAGNVFVQGRRVLNGSGVGIGPELQVAGLTFQPGVPMHVRVQWTGASPTTARIKVWTGSTEPGTWIDLGSNSSAALQDSGHIALRGWLKKDATNAVTLSFDNFSVE